MSFKFYVDEVNQGEGTRVPDGWFEPILREEDLAAAVAASRDPAEFIDHVADRRRQEGTGLFEHRAPEC